MASSKKINNTAEKKKDIIVPTMEEEIDGWCDLPPQPSNSKSIADIEIEDWCAGSKVSSAQPEKKKKN
ncbi:MAG: hypothetical protein KK926_00330 [Methanomethylovorans sp.]|nr:hypothetical protein [Methanomethylovorans sp.]